MVRDLLILETFLNNGMHRMGYEARARIWNYLILIQLNLKEKLWLIYQLSYGTVRPLKYANDFKSKLQDCVL